MAHKTKKSLIAGITVVVLVAVAAAVQFWPSGSSQQNEKNILKSVIKRLDKVQEVTFKQANEEVRLVLVDGQWQLETRGGFPASRARLQAFFLALENAKVVEAKTANPDYFETLSITDPGPESSAKLVEFIYGTKKRSYIFGKQEYLPQGYLHYVRAEGDNQVWLIQLDEEIAVKNTEWLRRGFFSLRYDEINNITMYLENGGKRRLQRKQEGDNIQYEWAGKGTPPSDPQLLISHVLQIASGQGIADVHPAQQEKTKRVVHVESEDGLRMTLSKGKGLYYLRFDADKKADLKIKEFANSLQATYAKFGYSLQPYLGDLLNAN